MSEEQRKFHRAVVVFVEVDDNGASDAESAADISAYKMIKQNLEPGQAIGAGYHSGWDVTGRVADIQTLTMAISGGSLVLSPTARPFWNLEDT